MTSNDTSSSQSGAGAGTGHHQDFRLGSDTRIHNDVEMNAKAPGMKFTRSGSAWFWSGAEIGDAQVGYQTG